jgi:hypothetical protein
MMTTTPITPDEIAAIESAAANCGYNAIQYDEQTWYVAVTIEDDDEETEESEKVLRRLQAALPAYDVHWTGNGATDADGTDSSDISITPLRFA